MQTYQREEQSSKFFIDITRYLELPYPAYIKNIFGIYLDCNQSMVTNLGLSKNEIIGKSNHDIFGYISEVQAINQNEQEVIETGKPKVVIEKLPLFNQPARHLLSYKIPYKSIAGKLVGLLGTWIIIDNSKLSTEMAGNQEIKISYDSYYQKDKFIVNNKKKISKREKECLYYLIRGMTAKEIGRVLNLSPRTIEFYIENMKKKFSCHNRIGLIAKAYDILESE